MGSHKAQSIVIIVLSLSSVNPTPIFRCIANKGALIKQLSMMEVLDC